MSTPLGYFDLVVKTVRGSSPIPEFDAFKVDRSEMAKEHVKFLKKKFNNGTSGHMLVDLIMGMGQGLLCKTWDKLSPTALTMCGDKSLNQLIEALKTIEAEKIPGDYIETGVWRGGLPIIMRAFLESVNNKERTVWLADSFKGLPEDSEDPKDKAAHLLLGPIAHLTASRKQVEKSLEFFGLKDNQVKFLEGWFKDTLRTMPNTPLALVRLDGDYYESTRDAIVELYPKLSKGGYLIVDDYNLPLGCKRAIDEYRQQNGITDTIHKINSQAIYWRKS